MDTLITIKLGEDLYGQSVDDLKERIALMRTEISRLELELTKKQDGLTAAEQIFGAKG